MVSCDKCGEKFKIEITFKVTWQIIEPDILLDFYCKEVRSILEFGVACWNVG